MTDPGRLAAVQGTGLLAVHDDPAFDRLTRMAARLLEAPVALVSLVDRDRQVFASCVGLAAPWDRETPLSHSFCQHAVELREPLVVGDARAHPVLRHNLAIRDLGVVAYAGIPLIDGAGHALGTLCVADSRPREWTVEQIETLGDLAQSVLTEIELRRRPRARGAGACPSRCAAAARRAARPPWGPSTARARSARVRAQLLRRERRARRAGRPSRRPPPPTPASGRPWTAASATAGMRLEHRLDLGRRDVLAAGDDRVGLAAGDREAAVGVERAEVAGAQRRPAAGAPSGRRRGSRRRRRAARACRTAATPFVVTCEQASVSP